MRPWLTCDPRHPLASKRTPILPRSPLSSGGAPRSAQRHARACDRSYTSSSAGVISWDQCSTCGARAQMTAITRRHFAAVIGGAAAAWPIAAQAQQRERMRRIGVLMPFTADDAETQTRMGAFLQALALSGWTIGHNVRIDVRWAGFDPERMRQYATELVAPAPDVLLAYCNSACVRLQ